MYGVYITQGRVRELHSPVVKLLQKGVKFRSVLFLWLAAETLELKTLLTETCKRTHTM